MKYKTEQELLDVVKSFENKTFGRAEFGHPEHLIVAFHYVTTNDFETALTKTRAGLIDLLKALKVDLTREMPFHETLTVFWLRTVCDFAKSRQSLSNVEICAEMIETFDKNYPLKFYSRELLFSDEARKNFVEPDLYAINNDNAF